MVRTSEYYPGLDCMMPYKRYRYPSWLEPWPPYDTDCKSRTPQPEEGRDINQDEIRPVDCPGGRRLLSI